MTVQHGCSDEKGQPNSASLAERITSDQFQTWYQERKKRENIQNGTPFFNGPAPIKPATKHSPSKLLQCKRKIAYQQLNAPEEKSDPAGIFWVGTRLEEDIALPFLQEAVTGPETYACNTLWVDFEVEHEGKSLQIKGSTDPAIVRSDGTPVLVTEIKTKSSVGNLDAPNRHHKAQAHAYMYGLTEKHNRQITNSVIIYIGRDNLNFTSFHVEFDPNIWNETILEWAATHSEYRLNNELPPADPEFSWECKFCPYKARCGQTDTEYEDTGAVGFLPLYADYPREKVVEYLEAHDGARLTPTLAHRFPDLVEEYGVFDWHCARCEQTYEWDAFTRSGESEEPPLCPSCLSEDRASSLKPPMPAEQHDLKRSDDSETAERS